LILFTINAKGYKNICKKYVYEKQLFISLFNIYISKNLYIHTHTHTHTHKIDLSNNYLKNLEKDYTSYTIKDHPAYLEDHKMPYYYLTLHNLKCVQSNKISNNE